MIKELIQENGVENKVEGIKPNGPTVVENNINIDGQKVPVTPPKPQGKKCAC